MSNHVKRKTVLTKTIDDLEIVIGFDELRVDPMETKRVVAEKLVEIDEAKELKRISEEIGAKYLALKVAKRERSKHPTSVTAGVRTGAQPGEVETLTKEIGSLESQVVTLKAAIAKKRREMIEADAVFFAPPVGEYLLADEEIADLQLKFDNLEEGRYLLKDGTVIEDLRGSDFWEKTDGKWQRGKVEKLGEKIDGSRVGRSDLKEKDLKEIKEQSEKDRIGALSDEEKAAEKLAVLEGLKNEAVLMKGRLEFDDDAEALTKAKVWFEAKKSEIDASYQ